MAIGKKSRSPRITVGITQESIDRGIAANSKTCMIAEAIKEQLPDVRSVSVDIQTIRFTDPKKGIRYIYPTPRLAGMALINFDQGVKPEPFTVKLTNAHVLRSRGTLVRGPAATDPLAGKKTTRLNSSGSVSPVCGKPPPQLKIERRFGLRAFR